MTYLFLHFNHMIHTSAAHKSTTAAHRPSPAADGSEHHPVKSRYMKLVTCGALKNDEHQVQYHILPNDKVLPLIWKA